MKIRIPFSPLIAFGLLLTSCAGNTGQSQKLATPTVLSRLIQTRTASPPTISIQPTVVSANTQMTIMGSGFPAGIRIKIYLGAANASETMQPYGESATDAEGRVALAFVMPAQWPSGAPIVESELALMVASEDWSVKATAPFSFQAATAAAPTPTRPQLTPTLIPTVTPLAPTREPAARVIYTFLNVRSGPGISYSLITKLDQGASMTLSGRNEDNTWVRIRLPDGREGWVSSEYIQASVAIASLPVILQPVQNPTPPASTALPAPANDQQAAMAAVIGFYTQWASGPGPNGNLDQALQYVSKTLADQIRADPSLLPRLVGVQARPRYTQVELLRMDSATALMRAALQLETGSKTVDTTLAKENGAWVIVKFQPVTQ